MMPKYVFFGLVIIAFVRYSLSGVDAKLLCYQCTSFIDMPIIGGKSDCFDPMSPNVGAAVCPNASSVCFKVSFMSHAVVDKSVFTARGCSDKGFQSTCDEMKNEYTDKFPGILKRVTTATCRTCSENYCNFGVIVNIPLSIVIVSAILAKLL